MLNSEFLITSLVVVLIPGTGVIYTISTALFFGRRAGVAAAVGCTAGIIPHLTASILGLSAILHMSAVVFQLVKYAGAAYLIFLAWSMWRDTGSLGLDTPENHRRPIRVAFRGVWINILNPKLSIFFLAFLPQFVAADASRPLLQLTRLSAVFMALTLAIFVIYAMFANGLRACIVNRPRRMRGIRKAFAGIFATMGIKLAISDI